ncbi:Locus-specific chromosome binding protein [Aphelenchoides avenae]|nr:Locus-specific chromosome binding protein [Aphelenchus avenae]
MSTRGRKSPSKVTSSAHGVPAGPSAPTENVLLLRTLNPYITCPICNGYFVDATTVLDCLHTFCKSCLLKHFEDSNVCPKCNFLIHQSHPSHYVAFDRTMQDIVYKLVPGMQAEEERRRLDFARKHREQNGDNDCEMQDETEPATTSQEVASKEDASECCGANPPKKAHHREDEPIIIELEPEDGLPRLDRSYIRLSGKCLRNRLLAHMLTGEITRYNEYDVFCNNELMGRDYSMAFIHKTRWRNKPPMQPVKLTYKLHVDY